MQWCVRSCDCARVSGAARKDDVEEPVPSGLMCCVEQRSQRKNEESLESRQKGHRRGILVLPTAPLRCLFRPIQGIHRAKGIHRVGMGRPTCPPAITDHRGQVGVPFTLPFVHHILQWSSRSILMVRARKGDQLEPGKHVFKAHIPPQLVQRRFRRQLFRDLLALPVPLCYETSSGYCITPFSFCRFSIRSCTYMTTWQSS